MAFHDGETKRARAAVREAMHEVLDLDPPRDNGEAMRALALVRTKLDEAEMWLQRFKEALGDYSQD